jgi:hypothetical protein
MGDEELEARGFWLYASVAFHAYLTAALIVPVAILSVFFFLPYIVGLTGLLGIWMGMLGGMFAMPLAGLMHVRSGPRFRLLVGQDNMLFGMGLACLILSILGVVNSGLILMGCNAGETASSFAGYIFNETCADLNVTITIGDQPAYRRPFFAFKIGWYQGCIDDYPVVIVIMVIMTWLVVHSAIAMGYSYRLRKNGPE